MSQGPEGPHAGDSAATPSPPPGWFPDPSGQPGLRYWDGSTWTPHHSLAAGLPGGAPPAKTSGFAVASLIFGIFGGVLPAIPFALVARRQIRRSGGALEGRGLATAGIVLSCAWLGLFALLGTLGAVGAFDEDVNTDGYVGEERAVAAVIDEYEAANDRVSLTRVCNELFTPRYKQVVEDDSGQSCVAYFEDLVGGRVTAEIKVESLEITGSTANVRATEAGEELAIVLIEDGGRWRINDIASRSDEEDVPGGPA